jgi:hypothetical protein
MCLNWRDEYEKHLLSEEIDQAVEIKNKHINRSFYKYRFFDEKEYWIDWVKGTLYANSPNAFNDPFDCMLTMSPETTKILKDEHLMDILKKKKLRKRDESRWEFSNQPTEAFKVIYGEQNGVQFSAQASDEYLEERFKRYAANQQQQYQYKNNFKAICFSEKKIPFLCGVTILNIIKVSALSMILEIAMK